MVVADTLHSQINYAQQSPTLPTQPTQPILQQTTHSNTTSNSHGAAIDTAGMCTGIKQFIYTILWPGLGLLGESYILFSIGTLYPIWTCIILHSTDGTNSGIGINYYVYYNDIETLTDNNNSLLSLLSQTPYFACLAIMMGMVVFGVYTNNYGRRYGSIGTALFMVIGCSMMTFVSIPLILRDLYVSFPQSKHAWYIFIVGMTLFGFGVGGEYPVAAASATERSMIQSTQHQQQANVKSGRHIQLIFTMQGVGILLQVVLLTILLFNLQREMRFKEIYYMDGKNSAYTYNLLTGYAVIWLQLYVIGTLILWFVFISRMLHLQESGIWKEKQQQAKTSVEATNSSNNDNNNNQVSTTTTCSTATTRITSRSIEPSATVDVSNLLGTGNILQNDDITMEHEIVNIHWTRLLKVLLFHSQYGVRLIGVSLSWFLWDVAFYGNKLFQSAFLIALTNNSSSNNNNVDGKFGIESMIQLSIAALTNSMIALCGYVAAAYIIDHPHVGRRKLQLYGFIVTGLLFIGVGSMYDTLPNNILILLYFGTSFFGQCGPNATTFILPSEVFPTQVRTICHGVAAASGKLGALIATITFHRISNDINLFLLSGCTSFIAAGITYWLIPETVGRDLRENDRHWEQIIGSYFSSSSSVGGKTDSYRNAWNLNFFGQSRQRLNHHGIDDNHYNQFDG